MTQQGRQGRDHVHREQDSDRTQHDHRDQEHDGESTERLAGVDRGSRNRVQGQLLQRAVLDLQQVEPIHGEHARKHDRQPQQAGSCLLQPGRVRSEREPEEKQHDRRKEQRAHGRVTAAELRERILPSDGKGDARARPQGAHRVTSAVAGRRGGGAGDRCSTPCPSTLDTSPRSSMTRPSRNGSRRPISCEATRIVTPTSRQAARS